jgi:predicted  nucleic acid-binding Zn-ribbon protein
MRPLLQRGAEVRYTLHYWICWCHHQNGPDLKTCESCGAARFQRNAQVHAGDRAVVFYNPATGEHRTPARADAPMPEVYARQGFERREILSMLQYERETGVVHEASNFLPGNEPGPREPGGPKVTPEARAQLLTDVRDMLASGPLTLRESDRQAPNTEGA